jgi:hypothetical protein
MIKFISLLETITLPCNPSTIQLWNYAENGKRIHVEETQDGFTFICGVLDGEKWTPTGDTVEVGKHMVKWVTRAGAKAVKAEVKK